MRTIVGAVSFSRSFRFSWHSFGYEVEEGSRTASEGGVESGGCRRTLITSRYVSLVSRPWNKKIHPLYKCMTNGWKLARSLLGRNEETLSRQSFLVISQVSIPVCRLSLFLCWVIPFPTWDIFRSNSYESYPVERFDFYHEVASSTNLISAQTFLLSNFFFFFSIWEQISARVFF